MAKQEKELTVSYDIYTGMRNPSKPTEIGWRLYESYLTKGVALKEAKRLVKLGGLVQVVRSAVIYVSPNAES